MCRKLGLGRSGFWTNLRCFKDISYIYEKEQGRKDLACVDAVLIVMNRPR